MLSDVCFDLARATSESLENKTKICDETIKEILGAIDYYGANYSNIYSKETIASLKDIILRTHKHNALDYLREALRVVLDYYGPPPSDPRTYFCLKNKLMTIIQKLNASGVV